MLFDLEAVPETKKVVDFLAGISCPSLQMGLNIVMSVPLKLSNFDVTQQFLCSLVANQANHNRIKNDERGISTVETFKVNKLKKEKGGKKLREKIGRQILSERQME